MFLSFLPRKQCNGMEMSNSPQFHTSSLVALTEALDEWRDEWPIKECDSSLGTDHVRFERFHIMFINGHRESAGHHKSCHPMRKACILHELCVALWGHVGPELNHRINSLKFSSFSPVSSVINRINHHSPHASLRSWLADLMSSKSSNVMPCENSRLWGPRRPLQSRSRYWRDVGKVWKGMER